MRAAPLLAVLLLCSCGRTTTYGKPAGCVREPQGTPFLTVGLANGFPRLWNRELCVPVTYAQSLEKLKPRLQAALDAWSQPECTGLCFEVPVQNKEVPTQNHDLRLHLADTGDSTPPSAWELVSDGRSGQTLHATIFVSSASTLGDLLKQLGFVLGFQGTKQFRDTVLEEIAVPNPRVDLGSLDRQSVCAAYPACR